MWQVEIVRQVRHLINDWEEPYDYSDDRIAELILVAAQYVSNEIDFSQTYEIDLDQLSIIPDPTDRNANTRDNIFINLVSLKAACLVDNSEARASAGKAFTLKQGNNSISFGGSGGTSDAKLKILEKGWCAAYQAAKEEYERGNYKSPSSMIIGPTVSEYGILNLGRFR